MSENQIFEVIISERAEQNLDEIIEYLQTDWNEIVKSDFLDAIQKCIDILTVNPNSFPIFSVKKNIRKCLITKHNAMYYRVSEQSVEIITIRDTRKNPRTLKL